MDTVGSSIKSVPNEQTTQHHIPQLYLLNFRFTVRYTDDGYLTKNQKLQRNKKKIVHAIKKGLISPHQTQHYASG